MRVSNLTIEVRNAAMARVGQVNFGELTAAFKAIKRFCNVGSWSMSLPADYDMAQALATPGAGIDVLYTYLEDETYTIVNGQPVPNQRAVITKSIFSGPVVNFKKISTVDDPIGEYAFVGVDDNIVLADGLAWPTPSTPDVTLQSQAYDVRTGKAETVMRDFVSRNIGPLAPAARRITNLALEATDGARGLTVTGRARFTQLGALLSELATAGGVGFEVVQDGALRRFRVFNSQDRTATVRMDVANDTLEEASHGLGAPSVSRAIVAGQGQGEERKFLQVTNSAATAAETAWGRKIEIFKDQRNTNDDAELLQSGQEILAEGGMTLTSIDVKPSDLDTMRFVQDWYVGDRVTAVVDNQEVKAVVNEAIIMLDDSELRFAATVGEPTGFDFESRTTKKVNEHEGRLANLERNSENRTDTQDGPSSLMIKAADGAAVRSIPTGAWTRFAVSAITATIHDTDTFTRTTNGFRVLRTGVYTVSAEVFWDGTTAGSRRMLGFFIDGVEAQGESGITANGFSAFTVPISTSMDFYLEANSLVELGGLQNSGANLDVTIRRLNARYHGPM